MVVHTFNHSTWKAEADGSLGTQGQPGLQRELQDSQGNTEKPCFKKIKKKKKEKKETGKSIWGGTHIKSQCLEGRQISENVRLGLAS